jgi:hypothetical protein
LAAGEEGKKNKKKSDNHLKSAPRWNQSVRTWPAWWLLAEVRAQWKNHEG